MPFKLSPAVTIVEKDLVNIIPAVATSIGAFVGQFQWGPVLAIETMSSEIELLKTYGRPDSATYASWFSAANFLAYGNNLKVVRVVNTGARNAVASGTAVAINNETIWEAQYSDGSATVGSFAAKYPGVLGNSLKVSMADSATFEKILTGTFTALTNSAAILGSGTAFDTETHVGAVLYDLNGNLVGTVLSIADSLNLTLTANAETAVGGAGGVAHWEFHDLFDSAPSTSDYATRFGGSADEVHIVVADQNGAFTGVPGTILETFVGASKANDAKTEQGAVNYYKDVLATSQYAWWMDHPTNITGTAAWGSSAANAFKTLIGAESRQLSGGLDGAAPTDGQIQVGWDLFVNAESVDVNLLIAGPHSPAVGKYIIENIAEQRLDCVGFVSPLLSDVYNNVGSEADDVVTTRTDASFNVNSSYGVMDSNWKYQYDKYNDVFRWLPCNPDIAGLNAQVDNLFDPWYAAAGYTRGQIKNVVKLAWNPDITDRDTLFKNSINAIVSQPGLGTVLLGDKTLLAKPSPFDAINVRRLFIVLEKAVATAAKFMLFEFNDAFTRAQFRNMTEPFLRDVQGRRGVEQFLVVCDTNNNTEEVRINKNFVADIFIVPNYAIRNVQLNFIAVRGGGVTFTEIVS
jgi:hypothetical protein